MACEQSPHMWGQRGFSEISRNTCGGCQAVRCSILGMELYLRYHFISKLRKHYAFFSPFPQTFNITWQGEEDGEEYSSGSDPAEIGEKYT